MKLCISSYSLANWRKAHGKTLEDTIDWVADLGVGAIEFAGIDEPGEDKLIDHARHIRRYCERRGLAIAGYCIGAELYGKKADVAASVARVKHHVDAAAELGVSAMRHDVSRGPKAEGKPGGGKSDPPFTQVVKALAPPIRDIADHALDKGVKTSLENHGFYLQKATRVERLIKAVDHENFGVTLDMGNFLCVNDDPVAAVERLLPYAITVHAKDFFTKPKKAAPPSADDPMGKLANGWIRTPTAIAIRGSILGHGQVDVPAQLKLLKRHGYDGFLSLEFEGLEPADPAVRLGLAYLREQCAKLKINTR